MRERTLSLSSTGKTYSFTGWKIGWATGPAPLVDAAQAAHQFVTFATATPLQVAMAHALREHGDSYLTKLRADYTQRRNFLVTVLGRAGFDVCVPKGTYFVLASFERLFEGDDRAFARWLIEEHGVAAIPPSCFYQAAPDEGRRLVRFAFCKRMETLERAAERIARIRP
jgi:N-succinyldiaminopimelate aminotransferase